MLRELRPHPDMPASAAIERIRVAVSRPAPAALALDFVLSGKVRDLRLPSRSEPARTDGLWRHSCFETFIALPGGGYAEANFSPSRQWAAYRFDAYRTGMRPLALSAAPAIEDRLADDYRFVATIAFDDLAEFPVDSAWRIGVSAVIEDKHGLSYWALAHPPEKADFHHRDCFVLEVPPA